VIAGAHRPDGEVEAVAETDERVRKAER
jgi:hypothetical protein